MVSRGHFVLHSRAKPPLPADDYTLEGDQFIPDGDGGRYATEEYRAHLRVMSPRFRLPPDQILSTFPPANAEGAFESRLPQIVLKRRTLPWEREVDADRNVPWLALVVVAEGEGTISPEVPVADTVTAGVTLDGYVDSPTGLYLSVPQTTVDKVFPTREDLHLLAHVREVDITDTELAIGDDDGFLAVVMANRLPQFDRVGCKPVRYLACLLNLEGQLDALPPPTPPTRDFFPNAVVFEAGLQLAFLESDPDLAVMGTPTGTQFAGAAPDATGASGDAAPSAAAAGITTPSGTAATSDTTAARRAVRHHAAAAAGSTLDRARGEQWRTSPQQIEALAVSTHAADAHLLVREAMTGGFRFPLEPFVREKTYRFPVLTHWSFTCTGAGSFETLMRGLDVGLLGTVAGRPSGKPMPECYEPPPVPGPPDAPAPRPAAELAETGHVGLSHLTRRGESVRAWYRGPLVPQLATREAAAGMAHVSDQLRRLIPDGREDLAYAGGFEIGRLLALSQPAVVAALMRWRREQFGAARARRLSQLVLEVADAFALELEARRIDTLGPLVGRRIVGVAADDPGHFLGDTRPLVDPGRPIALPDDDLGRIMAVGFGIEPDAVQRALRYGDGGALQEMVVPAGRIEMEPGAFGHLDEALDQVLAQLTDDVLARPRGGGPGRRAAPARGDAAGDTSARERGREALARLLRAAAREEREP